MQGSKRLKKRVLLRLQQLEMFLILMETGSIRATSEVAGITQSAISKSLKELETMMGVDFFQRIPGGLKPVPAAEAFSRYAVNTVRGFNALCVELDRGTAEDRVNFGVTGGLAKALLDDAIRATQHDAIWGDVHLHIEDAPALLRRLLSEQLDVLVMHVPRELDKAQFHHFPITNDALIAVAHPAHEVFFEHTALWHFPWEVPQPGDPTRQRMESAMEDVAMPWSASLVEYSLPMISNEVLQGNTVLWIARSHAQPLLEQGLLLPIPLPFEQPQIQIGCLKLAGKNLPPSASALWCHLMKKRPLAAA